MSHITFCQMTQDRLDETTHCLQKYLPYVDKAVVIDGCSRDNTIITLRNWAREEPKLEFYLCPWKDNFSEQRNNYLKHVPDNTYCLISDPDEWFEERTLKNLRSAIQLAESKNKDMIGFQCRSVSYRGPNRVWENLDQYHKRLLFKKYSNTHYGGNPHEHLVNHPHQIMDTDLIYEHVKQEDVIWIRGMRNYTISGGGPNLSNKNPYWVKFREIINNLGLNTWHEFNQYLMKGNIATILKDEFIKYLDLEEIFPGHTDGLSEMRECYKTYFRIYHPEEEPEELRNRLIP